MLNKILQLFGGGGNTKYESISANDMASELKNNKKVQVLDVRTAGEFSSGHIPKAKNINVINGSFKNKIQELDKSKIYYVYCRSGMRSAKACKILSKYGFEKVYNLRGGIMAWKGTIK